MPGYVACNRNQLTSWQGEVTKLVRTGNSVKVWISTDYDTKESLELTMPSWKALLGQFRLQGKEFLESDWGKVTDPQAGLRPGVRAVIWLCENKAYPTVINWQPRPE
ncbi:hypothetical protein MJO52_16365 [Microbulbifer variabilis]|uniref:Uncharacterized protein n=1 Tax=Microbulbifer variabilis TaxID=266805 RepID=A0ABY4VBS5_9GAMM|nr:hypothetical protein [Microbulbifer variabilis]USD20633.1 hypothetical protein MJO52_16365 [Microbulbifer variabilis]